MAFTRKTYTGPVKNRGTIARGGKKLADVSKEELDAFRKKAGNEDLSYKEALRKLLNADRNAKAKPKPKAEKKTRSMNAATKARVELNALEQAAKRGEDMSRYMKMPDNRPPVKGATFSAKGAPERKSPAMVKMPDNRPPVKGATFSAKGAPERKSPAMVKLPNNRSAKDARFDDKSLSVNQRIKNDIKDNLKGARSSNTGTDKRSVTQRIKDSLGMMSGGKVKGYAPGGDIKGYGKARGAKACKMR